MAKENKFILISMEDDRAKKIAEVLGNKTSKKIIDVLAESSELSEKNISDKIGLPINTVEYNLKKLVSCEIVEKTKIFFWSKKGKKIPTYKLSNKSIVISPRSSKISSKLKSLLPAFLVSMVGAFLVKIFTLESNLTADSSEQVFFATQVSEELIITSSKGNMLSFYQAEPWVWFLSGSILIIAIFAAFNWRKL
jgi:DNA-binding transcriptional ArsR family regulator